MTSVTATMRKKKPIEATVGLPRVVVAAFSAACCRTSCWIAPWIIMCEISVVDRLALQLPLEALDLGVVALVGPADVVGREGPREDDHRHAERDGEGGHRAHLLGHEVVGGGEQQDEAVVAHEEQCEQHEAERPALLDERLEVGGFDDLVR